MQRGVLGLICVAAFIGSAVAADTCETLIEQSNVQLETMRRHAASIQESLQGLNKALKRAEQRNAEQADQIERLQAELRARRAGDPEEQAGQRREFFRALRRRLPISALYEVLPDRLIIASDPVFIFGKGELGAEGRDRLTPLSNVLLGLVSQLPTEYPWRLRIEGHSDSRPLRSNKRFESNWELSAARSVSILRFLASEGLPEARLSAVGLADKRLRDPGESSAAHRRNRRIEIHLIYVPTSAD